MGFYERLKEAFISIIPVFIIVMLIHFFVVPMDTETLVKFILGTVITIVGLGIFLRGVDLGVNPLGEQIGSAITKRKKLWIIVVIGFIIGAMITIAEPDVQVLAGQVNDVSSGLVGKNTLVFSVAAGVGIFVAIALVRIVTQFPLRKTLLFGYIVVFIVAIFTSSDFLSIAFDSGGVTTGAMTVPFLLSLGMGVSSMRAGKSAEEDSFGIVGLASLGPILACLILGVVYR